MKRLFALGLAITISLSLLAQTPNSIGYQTVVRDNSNLLVQLSTVGIKISILQSSPSGSAVYVETHSPTTNTNGLASIEIGNGTVVSGTFSGINWRNGPYFIKNETDPGGGTNYTLSGISQLLSVPYALHTKTTDSITGIIESDPIFSGSLAGGITNSDKNNWNNKQDSLSAGAGIKIINDTISTKSDDFYLGQDTLGGIVYYLYLDQNGYQHGLIVSKTEALLPWTPYGLETLVNANKSSDGVYNTNLMPTGTGYARSFADSLGQGWYIPSIDELQILYRNRFHVNSLTITGLTKLIGGYWSSTENTRTHVFYCFFNTGSFGSITKYNFGTKVRAIKAF